MYLAKKVKLLIDSNNNYDEYQCLTVLRCIQLHYCSKNFLTITVLYSCSCRVYREYLARQEREDSQADRVRRVSEVRKVKLETPVTQDSLVNKVDR